MGTREHAIEEYLDNFMPGRKIMQANYNGFPDQIRCYEGRVILIEVKTADGYLSVQQMREHRRLRGDGFEIVTVYGHHGIDMLVEDLKAGVKNLRVDYA